LARGGEIVRPAHPRRGPARESPCAVSILGPLEVTSAEGEPVTVGGPRPRALLVMLSLHVGQVVGVEQLIAGRYGEDPPPAAANAPRRCGRGCGSGEDPRRPVPRAGHRAADTDAELVTVARAPTDGWRVVLFVDFARPLRRPWHRLNRVAIGLTALAPILREADRKQRRWAEDHHRTG
jgi:hypothetical protein